MNNNNMYTTIFPIRCFACGKLFSNKTIEDYYNDEKILEYCCNVSLENETRLYYDYTNIIEASKKQIDEANLVKDGNYFKSKPKNTSDIKYSEDVEQEKMLKLRFESYTQIPKFSTDLLGIPSIEPEKFTMKDGVIHYNERSLTYKNVGEGYFVPIIPNIFKAI